ncbi:MAG: acetyl-CoA carboxylase biotin carboxylase subunit [Eggerthellales bacterium]|nr:acetyl-CoA carboxylase biotin carboxylase subunit [Eggerthellales bacterium]
MFKRILVANRGEIAQRIIRSCTEMGIESVAVYSKADANESYLGLATESVCIGDAPAAESYLNAQRIIMVAQLKGCDAIHPGYGFLSENAAFARMCQDSGITFIGPSPEVIEKLGEKSAARDFMAAQGVPTVPGSDGIVTSVDEVLSIAEAIGYPILMKASAGGGGRGMRRADSPEDVTRLFPAAQAEAKACFGDDSMYVEKLVLNPKHVEVQVLADTQGNVVHLGERDCSVQRRNQKIMEESPCSRLSDELREKMGSIAVEAAKAVGYVNAGTVEFLLDQDNNFYFIEMNTRIQVEHPVTEMVYGVDLVHEQIRIAFGLPLRFGQQDLHMNGHAIECRITAEDPQNNFMPCPGTVNFVHFPAGCGTRVDSALYSGSTLTPYYDSMIAKIVVWAPTRLEAIRRMRRCLAETVIEGVKTNLDFNLFILFHGEYLTGNYDTGFIAKNDQEILGLAAQANKIKKESARS